MTSLIPWAGGEKKRRLIVIAAVLAADQSEAPRGRQFESLSAVAFETETGEAKEEMS